MEADESQVARETGKLNVFSPIEIRFFLSLRMESCIFQNDFFFAVGISFSFPGKAPSAVGVSEKNGKKRQRLDWGRPWSLDCCGSTFFFPSFLGRNKYKMKCVDEVSRNKMKMREETRCLREFMLSQDRNKDFSRNIKESLLLPRYFHFICSASRPNRHIEIFTS